MARFRDSLETVTPGQKVRMRVGRRWHEGTVKTVGTDFGGTPTASVYFGREGSVFSETRHEHIAKLRAVKP